MPPQRTKKQPAVVPSESDVLASFPAPPTNATSAATPSAWTPDRLSPSKKTVALTEAQKQALVDNLQLEITERARKLRSHYGFLAQGLRTRLDMRVNRIPTALRKTNIMELIEKYSDQPRTEPPTSTIARPNPSRVSSHAKASASKTSSPEYKRGTKRPSDEMIASDKENAYQEPEPELAMPKKRAKTTGNQNKGPPAANSRARQVSRQDQPLQVLSPKSNNSRTYPRSPLKDADDEKPHKPAAKSIPAPHMSPLKSGISSAAADRPASRAKAATGKRAAAATTTKSGRTTRASIASSNGSADTDATTGTTIIKRKAPATKAAAKKTAARSTATTKSAAAKATAAAKKGKENAPATTAGRSLRTRK